MNALRRLNRFFFRLMVGVFDEWFPLTFALAALLLVVLFIMEASR